MSDQNFKITKIEKLPGSEAEIIGEIALEFLNECHKEAVRHLKSHLNMPGFRPGQVPDDVVVKSAGEMRIMEETAEIALGKEYQNIVVASKLRPLTRPQISVTKLAPGIPLEFKVLLILEPEFDLPDYKKLAAGVTDEDQEKRRIRMLDALAKATTIELPKKFVEGEMRHMLQHFKQDLEKAGIKWAPYLEQIKKTEEEVTSEWKESVEVRAKNELIIAKIAEKENLNTYREVFELLEKKA